MRGNSHDRACAVAGKDIVGDEHRDTAAIHGVRGVHAQEHTGLFLIFLAFQIGLRDDGRAVLLHRLGGGGCSAGPAVDGVVGQRALSAEIRPLISDDLVDKLVFWRQDKVFRAEEGVGAGGEHGARGGAVVGAVRRDGEGYFRTPRPADPIALHGLHLVGPIQQVEVVEQAIRVLSDPHHPLGQLLAENREVATFRAAVGGDFFIGQDRAEPGGPIHC